MTLLVIEFIRPDGQLLRIIDAGFEYITSSGIPLSNAERPFRIETEGTAGEAKAIGGSHSSAAIPLPDGRQTAFQITGKNLPMAGKPLSLKARVVIDGVTHELTVNVTSQLNAIDKCAERQFADVIAGASQNRVIRYNPDGVQRLLGTLAPEAAKPATPSTPSPPPTTRNPHSVPAIEIPQSLKCPKCGSDLWRVKFPIGAGFNEFIGCSAYPTNGCDYKRSLDAR